MKWTKLAITLLIPMLALPLLGQAIQSKPAEARPTAVVTINRVLCLTMTASEDWDGDGVGGTDLDAPIALSTCFGLNGPAEFSALLRILGADPDNPTPEDLAPVDVEGGQFHQIDGQGYVIAFVSSDQPVGFSAETGVFPQTVPAESSITCGPPAPDYDISDEDCDGDGIKGDGVVVVQFQAAGADRGPGVFRVRQGMIEVEEPYEIVGEPHNIEVSPYKTTIQAGAVGCELFSDTATFLATLGAAETTPLISKVTDSDGTEVTAALVTYEIEPDGEAVTAQPLVPTLASALGVGAPNVLCGLEPGIVTLTASISKDTEAGEGGTPLDLNARERSVEVEITVQGPPEDMVLSAVPARLVCDGTATTTISATLTDGEGNPAVDGNVVEFESRALGIVSPREAKSAGGAATTVLTPLSGVARGVVVRAILMLPELEPNDLDDPDDDETVFVPAIEKTLLVECTEAAAPAPPAPGPPAPAPVPVIQPPPTGDGGYLP